MKNFFAPPKDRERLFPEKIKSKYPSMRLRVFLGAFFGYAGYYLVRKNLSIAAPDMINEGLLDKAGVGIAASAISIAYAFSKFIMGSISDRSDARKFLSVGLVLSALVMLVVGFLPYSTTDTSLNVVVIFIAMLMVGWLSGMGWPPCGRVMSHWFSQNERSFKMSLWNTSHTIGNGSMSLLVAIGVSVMVAFGFVDQTWRAAFIFPSIIAIVIALFCYWALRDRPTACGLPPIEEYRDDYSGVKNKKGEEVKIPFKRLFVDYIFKNKILWLIAIANSFVYLIRYGIADWAPVYLQEMSIMDGSQSKLAFALHNYAGVPGTIICGWISAKLFKGRCAPANVLYMILVLLGILLYWQAGSVAALLAPIFGATVESTMVVIVYIALIEIGFCIYGPVALIGVQALNLVPKNAAGTAAGFVGLFGYLIGDALLAKILLGGVAENYGWLPVFWIFIAGAAIATIFCATTWKREKAL